MKLRIHFRDDTDNVELDRVVSQKFKNGLVIFKVRERPEANRQYQYAAERIAYIEFAQQ